MAIIPTTTATVRLTPSAPVPVGGDTDARLLGTRVDEFGTAVQKFGASQLEMQRTLDREQGADALNDVALQSRAYADQTAKPDGSDYGQKVSEFSEPKVADIVNKFGGDPRTREQLNAYVSRVKGDMDTTVMIRSSQMLENNNLDRVDQLATTSGDRVRENPSEGMFDAEVRGFGATIDSMTSTGGLSPERAAKVRSKYYDSIATNYVLGLSNQESYQKGLNFLRANQENPDLATSIDPVQARDLGFIDSKEMHQLQDEGKNFSVPVMTKGDQVKLTPAMAAVSNGIDPTKKAHLIDQLERMAEQSTNVNLADLHAQVSGFTSLTLGGGDFDGDAIDKLKTNVLAAPNMTADAKRRTIDSINSAIVANSQIKLASGTPRSQWGALLKSTDKKIKTAGYGAEAANPELAGASDDFAVQNNRENVLGVVQNAMKDIAKEQEADPVKFTLDHNYNLQKLYFGGKDGATNPEGAKATQTFITQSLAQQKYLGIPTDKQQVLTNADAVKFAAQLKSIPDADMTNDMLGAMEHRFGSYMPRIMAEVGEVDKDVGNLQAGLFAPIQNRVALIDALKNEKAINDAFKTLPKSEFQKTLIDQSIRQTTLGDLNKVYTATSENSSGIGIVNNLQKAIELQTKRDLTRDPDGDVGKIVKKAYDDFVGSQYNVVSATRSTLLVPRSLGGNNVDPNIVKSFVNVYSQPENFADLNVKIPDNFKAHPEAFYEDLGEKSKWVMNRDGTGVRLMSVNPVNNRLSYVMTKNNHVIERSFKDINMKPGKKVLDDSKGFFGRLFGN